jgi:phosphatidylserine/phosphatidylglycerophosphate/cardiolipin synthase-like enzyme
VTVRAYVGDAKTLLAFNLLKKHTRNLAGFTIQVRAGTMKPYYILNNLQFEKPADHAQDPTLPPNSSFNAPMHKFRWVHVPGSAHQGIQPFFGDYVYTITPRYFDAGGSMQPFDAALSVAVKVKVGPFSNRHVALGFTRGFVQSQAFVRHFGKDALIRPNTKELLFDTSVEAGANAEGETFSYRDEYEWSGFTARDRIFAIVQAVVDSKSLRLDMFAYDLNEPDLIPLLLKLARQGRIRVILDNAALHHAKGTPVKPEDKFEALFTQAAASGAEIKRGKFGRYSHDKVLVVKRGAAPTTATKVLTGSTNFSITGMYVNSNHVLVFSAAEVAQEYAAVFEESWNDDVKLAAFRKSSFAAGSFTPSNDRPPVEISFSPHTEAEADTVLTNVSTRIAAEGAKNNGSVLFAVMEMDNGKSPVYQALKSLHSNTDIFSYGISDNPGGIVLYRPQAKTGVLVTGKPGRTVLPPPFNQVPDLGLSHQVHHKFVVCGFGRKDAVVYCGSSNLASGGEALNGDNLIAVHDKDVATVFAIEALALVDHFDFLDRMKAKAKDKTLPPPASNVQGATDVGWFLSTTGKWVDPYYDPDDLRSVDRKLFA